MYLKENSKIKDKFSRKFLPRNKKNLFFGSKMGVNLYTGLTDIGVNTAVFCRRLLCVEFMSFI